MSQHASDNDAKTDAPEIVKATNRIEIVILILPLAAQFVSHGKHHSIKFK